MVRKEFTIGSKRENAKEININLTKKHLYIAIVSLSVFTVLALLNYIDFGQTINYFVGCADGTKEVFEINKTFYCGAEMTLEMYNTFLEATIK